MNEPHLRDDVEREAWARVYATELGLNHDDEIAEHAADLAIRKMRQRALRYSRMSYEERMVDCALDRPWV